MINRNRKQIKKLKTILDKYIGIIEDGYTRNFVLKAFKFKKPLTSIEFYIAPKERVLDFMRELEDFFFIAYIHIESDHSEELLLLSRFKDFVDIAELYAGKHKGKFDRYAGLSGILSGYTPKKINRRGN